MSTDQTTDLQAVHYSALKLNHFTLGLFLKMPLSWIILENHFLGSIWCSCTLVQMMPSWSHWHSTLRVQEHGAFESRFSRPILKSVDLAPSHISALFFATLWRKAFLSWFVCDNSIWVLWIYMRKRCISSNRGAKSAKLPRRIWPWGRTSIWKSYWKRITLWAWNFDTLASNHQILMQSLCSSFEKPNQYLSVWFLLKK